MKLTRYRVTDFRSVKDSGWVDVDSVTALIGVNESGKTNLLLPLWKFNPAREGAIEPTADYPKRMFGEIRDNPEDYCFVTVEFDTGKLAHQIASQCGITVEQAGTVQVRRYFDGSYEVEFPKFKRRTSVPSAEALEELSRLAAHLGAVETLKPEESVKTDLLSRIQAMRAASANGEWTQAQIQQAVSSLEGALPRQPGKTSKLVPAVKETIDALSTWQAEMQVPAPEHQPGVEDLVVKALPKFIHYSNYGNLDSEIYLPHVVANLKRSDLGAKEGAKARTLRVLFNYVRLKPEEILELGQDFKDPSNPHRAPTDAEIDAIAKKKRERSILLHSADADLTSRFREWWKQGNYRFHFEADGNHFRIWVADDQRPENIELEARSTGLQWFFSFFLVFLVEATGEHKNAVLLLDEPGLSLHPIAQRDLSAFFDSLAETNQLVYTTHSPFLVDADRLDRVKKVYADSSGATVATSDLRKGVSGSAEAGAAYAVYSALNMSLAESLLLGCEPVIVEGPSDQHYLTLIKVLLISANKISPAREFVFPPAGGTKTLKTTAAILTGRDDALPFVLLDNDAPGARMAKELSTSLYEAEKDKVLLTDRFTGIERSEIEDLIPTSVYVEAIDKEFRLADEPFSDHVKPNVPIVPQVEIWAKNQSVELPKGWKVDVARRIKSAMLKRGIDSVPPDVVDRWTDLFQALEGKPSK